MTNLLDTLKELLLDHPICLIDGELAKNKITELALGLDAQLLEILLRNEQTKSEFFEKIGDFWVFDKIKFRNTVNSRAFLPNSMTEFSQKIGLADAQDPYFFLQKTQEYVLAFPFKDCVLQGGQSKDDAKRNEVFWHKTIYKAHVDKLLDDKIWTNFRHYTATPLYQQDGQQSLQAPITGYQLHENSPESLQNQNFLLKGNNLLVLHCLKKRFAQKVKLIYIDPPYNTGNDSFLYNDRFNHSAWLTFMKNRLEVAKMLLRNDGVIFISIDAKEIAYLSILCDEIFGYENRKNIITVKRSSVSGAKVINKGVVNVAEYILVYAKNSDSWNPNRVFRAKERDSRYNSFIVNYEDSPENWKFSSVLDAWADSLKIEKKNLKNYFKENYEEELDNFFYKNAHKIFRFAALDDNAVSNEIVKLKQKSKNDNSKVYILKREDKLDYYLFNGQAMLFFIDRLMEIDGKKTFAELLTDIWDDVLPNDLHNEGAVSMKKGKKPEKLIQRILELGTKEGDLVLDFFVGSGTTLAVAHKMGRRYIGIEQMDYIENITLERLKKVIEGEQGGISKAVAWQGGGSFVYAELLAYNQKFVAQIQEATTTEQLLAIHLDMVENAFLSYLYKNQSFEELRTKFLAMNLDEQKRSLLEILDMNQLYANLSEIESQDFGLNSEQIQLNRAFYESRT